MKQWEAGVIVTVRVEADSLEAAQVALASALSDAEDVCASRNVEFEYEIEDVTTEDEEEEDEEEATCGLCGDWLDHRRFCSTCIDNLEEVSGDRESAEEAYIAMRDDAEDSE